MKKTSKKTNKKPMPTYQFGGGIFDYFNNMNNSWNSFWRGGDYFNLGTQGPYNYDPLNPTVNQPIGKSKLMTTVDNNRAILDGYTSNKNAVDKAYKGDWGASAHDYYYNQSLGNTYSANQLESFVAYDRGKDSAAWKSVFGDLPQAGVPEGYNTWKAGRDAYADVAGAQYNADRQNIANQPLYNKALGSAFNNTASGIFSGLNYMNSYVPPEKVQTKRGFQGVQYAQNGGQIKTFINDPEYFNNRTFEDWQKKLLATGEVGIDENGVIHKLDKKVKVPQEWLDVTSGNYKNSKTKKKFQQEGIHEQARIGLNDFYNNPLSGLMGAGLIAPTKSMVNVAMKQAEQELAGNLINSYKDSLKYQRGGDTAQMGYTPGYPSMSNPYNKIPGDTITTQQTPINLLGIGSTGEIKIMKANNEEPYKFWGSKHVTEIPSLQFGGNVKNPNNFFTNVIVPSMMDGKVEHLQTEKGEVVFLPDGSLAETKATKKHKDMKKNEVTDILPEGYVFSNDPKMKFSRKSSILGTKIEDMNLGKSAFEYKENEVTKGPEDIMIANMFFGNSKKELTTADIAKNIKKNLPLVDMKGDWFADTANEENKEQRIEYFTILKSFNEFKKPKKNKIQHAQYGAQTAPKDYLKSGIDFMNNVGNPFVNMDNTLVSKFMNNQGTYGQLPAYQYGGDINHAPLGMMIGAAAAPLLGSLFGHIAGNSARRKQNRQNAQDLIRFNTYQDNLRQGIEKGVLADNVTNLATYAASLNVPLDKYDDMSRQTSMAQESFRKQKLMLESSRRNAGTYSGTGTSMARFMNPANMGSYLANLDNASKSAADQLTNQLATLEANRNTAITGLLTQSTANRNNALNKRDTQLYNANVAGIGNVGKSVSTGQMTMSNLNYELGLEGLTFEDQLRQRAQAAYDRSSNKVQGIFNTAGAGLGAVGNYMDMAKAGANSMTNATRSLTASMPQAVEQAAIENRNKVLQQNIISSGLRPQINPIPQLTYNPQTPFLPPLSSYPTNTIGYGAMDNGIWGATMQPINRIPLNPMYVPDPKSIIMQTPNNGQYTGYNFLGPQVQY